MEDEKKIKQLLRDNSLFLELSDDQIEQVAALMTKVHADKDALIVEEGDHSEEVFFIKQGSAEVIKKEAESGNWHCLATLQSGDTIGEMALLDKDSRSATVRAKEDCILWVLKIKDLESLSDMPKSLPDALKINLANVISQRLRHTNEVTVKSLQAQLSEEKARFAMGTIVCWLISGIACYVFILQVMYSISKLVSTTTMVSVPILIFFAVLTFFSIKRSGYSFDRFGITTKNWKKSVFESIIFSIPVMCLIVLGKWLFIEFGTGTDNVPLFYMGYSTQSSLGLILTVVAYSTFSPIQEFIARGGIQSAFQELLISKHKNLIAVLIANIMFSMTHIHISTVIALVVFIPGLFWGWLYYRHKTLIGVCISHIIIGLFAIRVVGFPYLSN